MNNPNSDQQPSASTPAPSEQIQPYKYTPLSGQLGYPAPALPGAQFNQMPGTASKQGSAAYQAEQDATVAKHQAHVQSEAAKHHKAVQRIRKGK